MDHLRIRRRREMEKFHLVVSPGIRTTIVIALSNQFNKIWENASLCLHGAVIMLCPLVMNDTSLYVLESTVVIWVVFSFFRPSRRKLINSVLNIILPIYLIEILMVGMKDIYYNIINQERRSGTSLLLKQLVFYLLMLYVLFSILDKKKKIL